MYSLRGNKPSLFLYLFISFQHVCPMVTKRPLPFISASTAPSRFMKVWKLPSNRTTSRTGLVSGTSCFFCNAFQKRGRSNVTTGGAFCVDAITQLYCSVDKKHVLSPGYMSTIGRKAIVDCSGYSQSFCRTCMIPCQFGTRCRATRNDIWLYRMHCGCRKNGVCAVTWPLFSYYKNGISL